MEQDENFAPEQGILVPVKQGGFHLQDPDGFLYRKLSHHVAKQRCYWYCKDKKTTLCTSTAVTNSGNVGRL